MTTPTTADPVMTAIIEAVTKGRAGDSDSAREALLALWATIGSNGDPLHRCTLAHYLADLYDDPAQALTWDVRALDAADAITEQRVQEHHAGLHVSGFYPSLHLNLADNYRRLESFDAASAHIDVAREHSSALPENAYGALVRDGIDGVAEAIARRDTTPRQRTAGTTSRSNNSMPDVS
ncbi:MAG: hypothetical protein GX610_00985 [Rhodococcus sp.]|nr:hypothetical protein [Rhodococcus sp. (in: high G+C Gram-positive bacteria)]